MELEQPNWEFARSLAFCIFGRAAQLEWVPAEPGLFLGSFFCRVAVTVVELADARIATESRNRSFFFFFCNTGFFQNQINERNIGVIVSKVMDKDCQESMRKKWKAPLWRFGWWIRVTTRSYHVPLRRGLPSCYDASSTS